MTNAERAEQLQTLAAMARQDGHERAAGILERASFDAARDDTMSARQRIGMLMNVSTRIASFWDAYDYAKLAAEVLS